MEVDPRTPSSLEHMPAVVTAAVFLVVLGTLLALHGVGVLEARGGTRAVLLARSLPFMYLVAFVLATVRRVRMAWSLALGASILLAGAYPVTWAMFARAAEAHGWGWAPPTSQLVTGLLASLCYAGAVIALLTRPARAWFGVPSPAGPT